MLATSLVAFAAMYCIGMIKVWRCAGIGRGILHRELLAFGCGWIALVVALVSPLDEWSETLFVAHMAQHELLMVVAAPLIALSSPLVAALWALPPAFRHRLIQVVRRPAIVFVWAVLTAPPTVWILHALALWIWHLPSLYEAALEHEGIHAIQHLCFYLTAALFWWSLVRGRYGRFGYGAAVFYLFATALHSGVLGALITFSPDVWYPLYASNSRAWGLTPLEDQQLAGLLMWVPAGLVFAIGGLAFFAAWLRESGRRARFASFAWLIVVVLGASGCRSADDILRQQSQALTSLRATTAAIGEAWLSGSVSTTYARTALDQTLQLIEIHRSELVASPQLLADPKGAELLQGGDRLSRAIGRIRADVGDGNSEAVRRQLAGIGLPAADPP
jgi:cytochrome c oxidase assembly factor CtaG